MEHLQNEESLFSDPNFSIRMTMSAFIFQTIDEENLKQLNDEQLLRLLEEAYHSKKLDEKNKSAIFKVRLNFHEYIFTYV